jgi:hypothetical protein
MNTNPATHNYYMNDQKQDPNPRGALFPAREAVSQQKIVQETTNNTALTQSCCCLPCSQNTITGKTTSDACHFTNSFLCTSTDHIRTFRSLQKQLFSQINIKTYDLEAIHHTFFAEEPNQNHDAYTNNALKTTYVKKLSGSEENDLVPSSLLIARTIQNTKSLLLYKPFLILDLTTRSSTYDACHQEQHQ